MVTVIYLFLDMCSTYISGPDLLSQYNLLLLYIDSIDMLELRLAESCIANLLYPIGAISNSNK